MQIHDQQTTQNVASTNALMYKTLNIIVYDTLNHLCAYIVFNFKIQYNDVYGCLVSGISVSAFADITFTEKSIKINTPITYSYIPFVLLCYCYTCSKFFLIEHVSVSNT